MINQRIQKPFQQLLPGFDGKKTKDERLKKNILQKVKRIISSWDDFIEKVEIELVKSVNNGTYKNIGADSYLRNVFGPFINKFSNEELWYLKRIFNEVHREIYNKQGGLNDLLAKRSSRLKKERREINKALVKSIIYGWGGAKKMDKVAKKFLLSIGYSFNDKAEGQKKDIKKEIISGYIKQLNQESPNSVYEKLKDNEKKIAINLAIWRLEKVIKFK